MSKLKYKVEYEFTIEGDTRSGVESEASWFLVDQQGNMYSSGPMKPVEPVGEEYIKCEPLIKIGEEWLSVDEIEKRLKVKEVEKSVESWTCYSCGLSNSVGADKCIHCGKEKNIKELSELMYFICAFLYKIGYYLSDEEEEVLYTALVEYEQSNIIPGVIREKMMSALDIKINLDYINTWLTRILNDGGLSSVFKDSLQKARARINNVRIDLNQGDAGAGH